MKTLLISLTLSLTSFAFSAEPVTDTEVENAAIVAYLNTASSDELESVKGIGEVLSSRIEAARPFTGIQEIYLVKGIGEVIGARIITRALAKPEFKTAN